MLAESADLGPLVDHHCHGLVLHDLDRPSFEAMMNEAAAASVATTFFDSMLGLAVRRWAAPVLGLEVARLGRELPGSPSRARCGGESAAGGGRRHRDVLG